MAERKVIYQKLEGAGAGFVLKAPTLERLFIDAGLALTDCWTKLDFIGDDQKRRVTLKAASFQLLMPLWLNELITLARQDKFLAKRIVFDKFDGQSLTATLFGELHSPVKHGHLAVPVIISADKIRLEMISDEGDNFSLKVVIG